MSPSVEAGQGRFGRSEPWQAPEGNFGGLSPALKERTTMMIGPWDLCRLGIWVGGSKLVPSVLLTGFSSSSEESMSISSYK